VPASEGRKGRAGGVPFGRVCEGPSSVPPGTVGNRASSPRAHLPTGLDVRGVATVRRILRPEGNGEDASDRVRNLTRDTSRSLEIAGALK